MKVELRQNDSKTTCTRQPEMINISLQVKRIESLDGHCNGILTL